MNKLVIALVLGAAACHSFRPEQRPVEESLVPTLTLRDTSGFRDARLICRQSVRTFYKARGFELFWLQPYDSSQLMGTLVDIILHSGRYGLLPDDYHRQDIQRLLADTISVDRDTELDLLLTDSYFALYSHLREGRLDPRTLRRRDLSAVDDSSALRSLDSIRTPAALLARLEQREPALRPYQLLKEALSGSWDAEDSARAIAIALNMERWRWEKPWPSRYVYVNIPAFALRVVEGDSVWINSRVIVGKRETPTPEMESVIRSFVIYPYWHAPFSIATKEILPALRADAGYLERNNFEVLDKRGRVIVADTIRWERYSEKFFPFILRQREGTENSMGIIRFNFANRYGVYLHDTNSRRLFNLSQRNLSHGCVRVDRAVDLAHYLVREDDIYVSPEDLDQYLSLQQRLQIELRKPVRLRLGYFTAEVVDGETLVYEDIYRKDSLMMESLRRAPDAGDNGRAEVSLF